MDPEGRDGAYVIRSAADVRTASRPAARVRVYETRDAGATWTQRGGDGLHDPENAYLTVLRGAID